MIVLRKYIPFYVWFPKHTFLHGYQGFFLILTPYEFAKVIIRVLFKTSPMECMKILLVSILIIYSISGAWVRDTFINNGVVISNDARWLWYDFIKCYDSLLSAESDRRRKFCLYFIFIFDQIKNGPLTKWFLRKMIIKLLCDTVIIINV